MRIWLAAMLAGLSACCHQPPPILVLSEPAQPMPFCTRTLGLAQCFADPASLPDHPSGLGSFPIRVHRLQPWWSILD